MFSKLLFDVLSSTLVANTDLVLVPFPNWPTSFNPHAYTSPVLDNANTWSSPADTFIIPVKYSFEFIFTCTGLVLFVLVPSPNCPFVFNPVVHTVPSAFSITVKFVPWAILGIATAFSSFWITVIIACAV